jgi:hypothetical protein
VTARPLLIVVSGDSPGDAARARLGAEQVLVLGTDDVVAATASAAADVAWLPPWGDLGADAVAEVAAWRARVAGLPAASLARAARVLRLDDGTRVRLPARIALSTPGAVVPLGDEPRALPGARIEDLAVPWDVALPADLASHLAAVNEQSSVAARLRHAAGRTIAWRDLTTVPAGYLLRALGGVRGSRRVALPHLVIEAYREVLVAAKLWELASGQARA